MEHQKYTTEELIKVMEHIHPIDFFHYNFEFTFSGFSGCCGCHHIENGEAVWNHIIEDSKQNSYTDLEIECAIKVYARFLTVAHTIGKVTPALASGNKGFIIKLKASFPEVEARFFHLTGIQNYAVVEDFLLAPHKYKLNSHCYGIIMTIKEGYHFYFDKEVKFLCDQLKDMANDNMMYKNWRPVKEIIYYKLSNS